MRSEFEHHFRYLVPKRDFTDSEPSLLIDEFTDQRFPIPFLLVDENHKELVVDSLWEAAGRPQGSKHADRSTAQSIAKIFFGPNTPWARDPANF